MRFFSAGSRRQQLRTVTAAAALVVATMAFAGLADADSHGSRSGVEARPTVSYGTQIASASPGVSHSVAPVTYGNSPIVVMAPVTQPPVMIAPVSRTSMLVAQANSTCTEGNWRRPDALIVYGIACYQSDGTWRLVQ